MTVVREAFSLPILFLTVTLLGGLRPGARVVLQPPSLFSLILAVLLIGALVRSRALVPEQFMNAGRSALENGSGFVVLAGLFMASAQVLSLATPESGLPRVIISVLLLTLLLNTLAASPDRVRALRSLMVIFGSAFTLKFVVLAALSDPAGGRLQRALQALLEGVTLGTLTQAPLGAAAGYLAFFTFLLFIIGVALLRTSPGADSVMLDLQRNRSAQLERAP